MKTRENELYRVFSFVVVMLAAGLLVVFSVSSGRGQNKPEKTKSVTGAVPHLDLPEFGEHNKGSGKYTGFNSLNLQEIYVVEKQPAVRSQIAHGH